MRLNPHKTAQCRLRKRTVLVLVTMLAWMLPAPLRPHPATASSWDPAVLVNSEAFNIISDKDATADISLKFGDTLAKTLTYNRTLSRFEFSDRVYVDGNLTVQGSMSGNALYVAKSFSGAGLTSCMGSNKLLWDASNGRFSCDADETGAGLGQSAADARYVNTSGDTMTGALTVNLSSGTVGIDVKQTLSGAQAHATAQLRSSGTLTVNGVTKLLGNVSVGKKANPLAALDVVGTVSGSALTFMGGSSYVLGNLSVGSSAAARTKLEVFGSMSGNSLFVSRAFSGAGLSACNSANQAVQWNATTQRFECTTIVASGGSFGTGNTVTIGDSRYVLTQGDAMTGTLTINVTNGTPATVGLNALQTVSGAQVHAASQLRSSGSLSIAGAAFFKGGVGVGTRAADSGLVFEWIGSASGNILHAQDQLRASGSLVVDGRSTHNGVSVFNDDALSTSHIRMESSGNQNQFFLNASTNRIGIGTSTPSTMFDVVGTVSGSALTFMGGTSYILGDLAIGTANAAKTKLEVLGTISGSALSVSALNTSGALVYSRGSLQTLGQTAQSSSGNILVGQGANAPVWKQPISSLVWFLDGNLSVTTAAGAVVTMPVGFTATSVSLRVHAAPTGADLTVDINKDGSSIFGTRPSISAGQTSGGGGATFTTTDLGAGSIIDIDIDQVGSTIAGSGLTIMLNGYRKY